MEFTFDFRSLMDPKKRLLLGILLLVIGVACVLGHTWNAGVSRDNCITVEAIFDDCKYRTIDEATDSNSIYLTFQDYSSNLDIHPSCANDMLTQDLMELRAGTKMQLVVNEETRHIYELKVAGETWLSFEEAMEKIGRNMILVKNLGYAALAAGAICLLTAIVSLLWSAIHRNTSKTR